MRYATPGDAEGTLRLYDVLGRVVQTVARGAEAGREVLTRRLTVVR